MTYEELRDQIPKSPPFQSLSIEETEAEFPEARGLAPMTAGELRELILDVVNLAFERALTKDEFFLSGQLICAFEQAVAAAALGYRGRWFAMSEEVVLEHLAEGHFK
jgi:hypothetical protein